MKPIARALVVLALSCGTTTPICTTKCGMRLMGDRYGNIPPRDQSLAWSHHFTDQDYFSCQQLQWAEDVALNKFSRVTDSRFSLSCDYLHNTSIYVQPTTSWVDEWGRRIGGMTDPRFTNPPLVYVGNAPPLQGSLVHELAHVIQRCSPRKPTDPGQDDDHANWTRDGIDEAKTAAWRVFDDAMEQIRQVRVAAAKDGGVP